MTTQARHYPDIGVRPEVIRDAPLLTLFLVPSPAIAEFIPAPLLPRIGGRVVLNMWHLSEPQATTGFGEPTAVGVTYLAAEVAGDEGVSSDGATRFSGRFWLEHWSSSRAARRYAALASGLEIKAGETHLEYKNGLVTASLQLAGQTVITAMARVGRNIRATVSGHSIYYAERISKAGNPELARFEVPWVSDVYDAGAAEVHFSFAQSDPALRYIADGQTKIADVGFRIITLVPYLARGVVD